MYEQTEMGDILLNNFEMIAEQVRKDVRLHDGANEIWAENHEDPNHFMPHGYDVVEKIIEHDDINELEEFIAQPANKEWYCMDGLRFIAETAGFESKLFEHISNKEICEMSFGVFKHSSDIMYHQRSISMAGRNLLDEIARKARTPPSVMNAIQKIKNELNTTERKYKSFAYMRHCKNIINENYYLMKRLIREDNAELFHIFLQRNPKLATLEDFVQYWAKSGENIFGYICNQLARLDVDQEIQKEKVFYLLNKAIHGDNTVMLNAILRKYPNWQKKTEYIFETACFYTSSNIIRKYLHDMNPDVITRMKECISTSIVDADLGAIENFLNSRKDPSELMNSFWNSNVLSFEDALLLACRNGAKNCIQQLLYRNRMWVVDGVSSDIIPPITMPDAKKMEAIIAEAIAYSQVDCLDALLVSMDMCQNSNKDRDFSLNRMIMHTLIRECCATPKLLYDEKDILKDPKLCIPLVLRHVNDNPRAFIHIPITYEDVLYAELLERADEYCPVVNALLEYDFIREFVIRERNANPPFESGMPYKESKHYEALRRYIEDDLSREEPELQNRRAKAGYIIKFEFRFQHNLREDLKIFGELPHRDIIGEILNNAQSKL